MIETPENDIIAFLESESMDSVATYLQSGRMLADKDTKSLEDCLLKILRRHIENRSDEHDRVLLSWMTSELILRDEIRTEFVNEFQKLREKLTIDEGDLAGAIKKYFENIKNKN
jgi:hypothetical protein